jgi:predicted CoA-binding protein
VRLISHVLGHKNWAHVTANFSVILLIGPILEEKYGSARLIKMMLITALITGVLNAAFFTTGLLGASGLAFMMILLVSFTNHKEGEIPLTFVLVVVLFLARRRCRLFPRTISRNSPISSGGSAAVFSASCAAPAKGANRPHLRKLAMRAPGPPPCYFETLHHTQGKDMDGKNKVAVLGASDKAERYSNLLIKRLRAKGHAVFPVNPALPAIDGLPVYRTLQDLPKGIDVLTVYMNAGRSDALAEAILASGIPRVIFNPGAENEGLAKRLRDKGFRVEEACSLVLSGIDRL